MMEAKEGGIKQYWREIKFMVFGVDEQINKIKDLDIIDNCSFPIATYCFFFQLHYVEIGIFFDLALPTVTEYNTVVVNTNPMCVTICQM